MSSKKASVKEADNNILFHTLLGSKDMRTTRVYACLKTSFTMLLTFCYQQLI